MEVASLFKQYKYQGLKTKRFSPLRLVLMTVSSVAALVLPAMERSQSKELPGMPGTLLATSGSGEDLTCVPKEGGRSCTASRDSSTTAGDSTSDIDHSGSSSTGSPDGDGHTGIPS